MRRIYTSIISLLLAIIPIEIYADIQIQMEEYGGVFRVPCIVNGAKMKLIFDTGASNVCLSMQIAEYLYDNDYITADDFVGSGSSSVADGRIVDHLVINLKDIEIGGLHLHNVQALVIDGQNAPLLLGQSAIQQFGSIELSGSLLTIHNDQQNDYSFIDELFNQANEAYNNNMYAVAMDKYSQLHVMGQLSEYGKYRYSWACLMNEEPLKAYNVISEIKTYDYFEENKIDIYRLLGFIHQDLNKNKEAANYFALSSKKIQTEIPEWIKNQKYQGDCYFDIENYSKAGEHYNKALLLFGYIHNIDLQYIQHDCKNQLKKKQLSYRTDELDYLVYYTMLCYERSGEWGTDAFLLEAKALARAGNKYATRMLNNASISIYNDY